MARHVFGLSIADYVVGVGVGGTVLLESGATVTFWSARTGGSQYTDLSLNSAGTLPASSVLTSTGSGGFPEGGFANEIWGPDNILGMWASADAGPRVWMVCRDLPDVVQSALVGGFLANFTAKGDLAVGSGSSTVGTVHVGSDGQILTADSTTPTGTAWKDAGSFDVIPYILGGGNFVPNPSFGDGTTSWTAASGSTLALDTSNGVFGVNCGKVTRNVGAGTGVVSAISNTATVKPGVRYSASGWVRLGSLGGVTPRTATMAVTWYTSGMASIRTDTGPTMVEDIQGTWLQCASKNMLAPSTAAFAKLELAVAAVPESEYHFFDGFQLEPGELPSSFNSNYAGSTLTGSMLTPATVTKRETAVGSAKIYADLFANRPAAGTAGVLFFATDTAALYYDNGSTWTAVSTGGGGGGVADYGSAVQGYNGWVCDPVAVGAGTAMTSARIQVIKVTVPTTTPILGVAMGQTSPATSPANSFVGLLDSTGSRVAVSADLSSGLTGSNGGKKFAFTGSYTPTPGTYYVVLLFGGTTPPTFARTPLGSSSLYNLLQSTAPFRSNTGATSQSSIPSSITLSGLTPSSDLWWVGLYTV
jgi:hypothetical protein